MAVTVHGHAAREGETAFAFFVLRMCAPIDRDGLVAVLRHVAPLIPDADAFVDELPGELDQAMQIIGIPWLPAEAGHPASAQRRLIEGADVIGIEAAWFFQTGTSLPTRSDADADGDDEDEDDDDSDSPNRAPTTDDAWSADDGWGSEEGTDANTMPISVASVPADPDAWSHGLPPEVERVRFPVDGYPGIIDELDWEDFGIAFKLAGPAVAGESTVLRGFHTLWLAPYGGRYRNAAVTIDRDHHAAHLWVDRFAAPSSAEQQVRHLLWIVSRIDQVLPVVHARFGGATVAQKYGGLMSQIGDASVTREPFVLGGNPLLALHAAGGEQAVDAWLATQTEWSERESAQMLRELAIELVTSAAADAEVDADDGEVDDEADEDDADADDDDDAADDDDDDDDNDDDNDDDGDDESEGNEDEDRGRHITSHAGELLRARAIAGKLDARVAEKLLVVLDQPAKYEHRRRAVVDVLGALRYRPAVPAMIRILETSSIESALDSIGKEDFVAATAAALGAIGDPAAIAVLSKVVAAQGTHNDKPRPVAADALATCLAAAPEPRDVDDAVLAELLTTIRGRNDAELNAESHFAYGRIARQLPPDRRAEARRRLAEIESARDDKTATLARQAAFVLASPAGALAGPPSELAALVHDGLTSLDYDHDYTVRNLRVALRVADVMPEVVDPTDLVWLTRFAEPDLRERAHGLLDKLGHALPPAPVFDRGSARALDDAELIKLIGEPHVVGRAALVAEAGRRALESARRAIIDACHDVIARARQGHANLLDHDTRVLEAAVLVLRDELDVDTIALFDRMLRHSNYHVKWELLQAPPDDERLIGGMFHVLGEKWGWQERTAKHWLVRFQGNEVYEAERKRAGAAPELDDDEDSDDEDMN